MTVPVSARRLDPDERRSQLVAAGLVLVKTTPLDSVTATAVAGIAGVSKGLVFHYFPTQRELQAAIAGAAADELLELFTAIDPALDRAAQLRAGLEGFISYIEQRPASYAAIARDAGSDELLREVFDRTRDAIVATIARGVGVDEPTPAMSLYLRGWVAMAEETTLQWILTGAIERDELVSFLEAAAFALLARAIPPAGATEAVSPT